MSCMYYRYNGGLFSGDYWCDKKNCKVSDDDYHRYCKNYSYDECPIYKQQESSGCFITTIVCQLRGKKDNDVILQTLRNFRDNVLQKNEKYFNILKEYDVIGPIIAECLSHEDKEEDIVKNIYSNHIIPIYYLIYHKKYEEAVNRYKLMTKSLIEYYGLNEPYQELKNKDFNYPDFIPEKSGHGKKLIKSIETTQNV